MLFAWRAGRDRAEPHAIEIATYPELRTAEQALRDLLLVDLVRDEVPDVIVVVLRPKGRLRVPDRAHRPGPDGVTQAELRAIPRPPEPWDPADEPEPKAREIRGDAGHVV